MTALAPVLARIVARYLAGALVAVGALAAGSEAQIAADPEVLMILGGVLAAITEALYGLARAKGWSK
jgi:hypothetical protein